MTVVDAHVHVYPEKIALRAAESVGDFYQYPMFKEGSIPAMLAAVEGSPITHHIIYSVATKPSNVESINDFIAAECEKHPNFVGFMAMHQDYPNPEAEIERAIGLGLRGMKLHPDTQKVNMDDDRLMRVDRGPHAARHALRRLPNRFLAPAPNEAHPARVPEPRR